MAQQQKQAATKKAAAPKAAPSSSSKFKEFRAEVAQMAQDLDDDNEGTMSEQRLRRRFHELLAEFE